MRSEKEVRFDDQLFENNKQLERPTSGKESVPTTSYGRTSAETLLEVSRYPPAKSRREIPASFFAACCTAGVQKNSNFPSTRCTLRVPARWVVCRSPPAGHQATLAIVLFLPVEVLRRCRFRGKFPRIAQRATFGRPSFPTFNGDLKAPPQPKRTLCGVGSRTSVPKGLVVYAKRPFPRRPPYSLNLNEHSYRITISIFFCSS